MRRTRAAGSEAGTHELYEASSLTRREFLLAGAGAGAGMLVLGLGDWSQCAGASPLDLDVVTRSHPRTLAFRQPEADAASGELTYEEWAGRYLPLDGIVGKALNEELDYAGRVNLSFFQQFKQQHPEKMVLLHYNGTGRRATDEATTKFFPGHFLHYKGTRLTQPLAASVSASVLHVADTSVFSIGRYKVEGVGIKDDIVIVPFRADGKPWWGRAEQLRLQTIDVENNTITVDRGAYGTRPRPFPVGSYLAAHVMSGPHPTTSGLLEDDLPLWNYNFSTACPRDGQGRNCGDALVDYLGEKLGPEGDLSLLDGITLDVFRFTLVGSPIKDVDVNMDGVGDGGIIRDADTVSFGSLKFLENLRDRLPDRIILSDGNGMRSQRGFGYLNGIESEGYSDLFDVELDHLSKGENLFDFWKRYNLSPSINYLNYKYRERGTLRARNTFLEPNLSEDRSYEKLRLALASALFTDSAFAYGYGGEETSPPEVEWTEAPGGPTRVRVFDELWKGTEQVRHWLGEPLGPAVHLAEKVQDLFEGQGESWPAAFIDRFEGKGCVFSKVGPQQARIMAVRYVGPYTSQIAARRTWSFVLPGIEGTGEDLFVSLRLRAEPLGSYPASVPRRVDVYATPSGGVSGQANQEFTWANRDPFDASLYFQDVGPGTVDLWFTVEGGRPVYFERLMTYPAPDGRYREYEGGVVFANPSTRPYTFDVGSLFPGVPLRRLQGTETQDPVTNDGSPVGDELTLPAKDGLLVVKVQPPAAG